MAFADEITVEALDRDPYPIYARLRREAPVCWVPAANLWFVTRWRDAELVSRSGDLFTASVATSPVDRAFGKPTILTCDGPVHRELRRGIDQKYKVGAVRRYIEDLVRPIAREHLERIAGRGEAELMSEYFEPISTLSLARSFGILDVDAPRLRRWFAGLSLGAANFECDPAKQAEADRITAEIDQAVGPIFERLEREPDDSALSHMLHDGMPPGLTRPRELLLPTVKVTLLGGMQEPGHGAGSILIGLLTHPEQMRAVRADLDGLLPKAVDEGLRWVAPIGTQTRQSARDMELGGTVIPAEAPVAAVLSSACRDEARFHEPDSFDIARTDGAPGAFGFGSHFCAGRWFAHQQVCIALRVLLEGLPDLALMPGEAPVFRGWEFRAPTSLRVTFRAA
jgi:cytochrome P450